MKFVEMRKRIEHDEIGVMAGFQGISEDGSITTLGRGGSDTSAVALAIALKADRCDIYTDVDGVYTTDPRLVTKAHKMPRIAFEEMLELASLGAKVLQTRSVELAMKYNMPVQVLSTFAKAVGSELPGTLVTQGDKTMEQNTITGIAFTRTQARVTLVRIADRPGVAAAIFGPLSKAAISVDMIVQTAAAHGETTDITFTVNRNDVERTKQILEGERKKIGFEEVSIAANVAKISLVGAGMKSHHGVAATMFQTLADKKINIQAIETSEIVLGVLIDEEYTELAMRALHTAYGLDTK